MRSDPLIDADERTRLILSQLPVVMWTTDTELRFTSSRGSALASLNLTPDQVVGTTVEEFFAGEGCSEGTGERTASREHLGTALHRPALEGHPSVGEIRAFGRVFQCFIQPITDEDGAVSGTVGVGFDVTDRKRVEEAYRQQGDLMRAITTSLADGLIAVDRNLRVTFINDAAERILGVRPSEAAGRDLYEVTGAEIEPGVPACREDSQILRAIDSGEPNYGSATRPSYYRRTDGVRIPILGATAPIVTEQGIVGAVVSFRDITDFHTLQGDLRAATERSQRRELALVTLWRLVSRQDLDRDALAQAILAEGGRALELNRGSIVHAEGETCVVDYLENFGDPARYAGLPLREAAAELAISNGKTYACADLAMSPAAAQRRAVTHHGIRAYIGSTFQVGSRTYVLSFASSTPRGRSFDEDDRTYIELLAGFIARHLLAYEQQERILQLASIDPLTGLPNRAYFARQLEDRLAASGDGGDACAVLAIGLDRFKDVNSLLGRGIGDRVLLEASSRLRKALRGETILARLGDDEFAALLPRTGPGLEAEHVARRVCDALAVPYAIGDERVHLTASVGVVAAEAGVSPDDLLLRADVAMHAAKRAGRNRYRSYTRDLALHLSRRRDLESGLRKAVAQEEFFLTYQPLVNLIARSVVGVEALIRWRRPGRGVVGPDEFIALAEESGLIVPIGAWALTAACRQAKTWASLGKALRVTVNISARQLQDPGFIGVVEEALESSGVDPTTMGLEVTESVAIGDLFATRAVLQRCKDLGLRIALDDFGTSYSSLAYLRELPIDTIKVDRRFVEGLTGDRTSAAITRAIIAFGTSLGFDTLAEGVESLEQERWLAREGCRTAQGYLFARPMAAEEFEAWLASWPHRSTVA